jgi:Fic family protein
MTKNIQQRLGTYIKCNVVEESYQAFVPTTLPPKPPLDLTALQDLISNANQAIGKLDIVSEILPDSNLLLYYYVRKEAVLSSQIEGTQSSLSDLILYESDQPPSVPIHDVSEVSSYVKALEHGLKRTREGFPLSLRLIREMHAILLAKGRGNQAQIGEFRVSQNWIGGTRPGNAIYVPPPPEKLMECLDSFEKYLHLENRPYSSLIEAGLIHVQFETIHPFLDGNGRIGRLLITFFLILMGDLKEPYLYLSLYFKNNRSSYYEKLNAVRTTGDWEGWLEFFLTGVSETATQITQTSQAISKLFQQDEEKITSLKRASISAHKIHGLLKQKAIINIADTASSLDISLPTARKTLKLLADIDIVKEIKGTGKTKLYVYHQLIELLEEGTNPIDY